MNITQRLGKKTIYGWALVARRKVVAHECCQSRHLLDGTVISIGYANVRGLRLMNR